MIAAPPPSTVDRVAATGSDPGRSPARRPGDLRLLVLAVTIGSVPLTGLVLPGSFLVFDALAAIAVGLNWSAIRLGRLHVPAWTFAATIIGLTAIHQLQPAMPASSGLIFGRAAITCLLVSLTLAAARGRGATNDQVLTWFVLGATVTALWAIAAEASPSLDDLAGVRGDTGRSGRSIGLSRHPNLLGLHVALAAILLHGTALRLRTKLLVGVALLAGLVLAGSRSGFLAVAIGLALTAVASRSGRERRRAALTAVIAGSVTATLVATTGQGRFLYDRLTGARGVTGDDERRELLDLGLDLMARHPLVGAPYEGRLFHSIYVSYPVLLGLGGLVALVALIGWSLRLSLTRTHSRGRTAAVASIVSLAIVLATHNAVSEPVIWLVLLSPTLLVAERSPAEAGR